MIFTITLGIFLFLSPIITILGNNGRVNGIVSSLQYHQNGSLSLAEVQLQFFQLGAVALFIAALFTKPVREFKDKYAGMFLACCFINIFFHTSGIKNFQYILLGFLIYYTVVTRVKNIKGLFWIIFAVAFLNTIFAGMQFFGMNLIYQAGRVDGLMKISNHLGIYQALALPIAYALHPYLAIIPLIGLLLSKSITAWIASLIGMSYLLWHKRYKMGSVTYMCFLSVIVFLAIRYYKVAVYKMQIRTWVWWETFAEIIKKPLSGHGIGGFQMTKEIYGQFDNPYNLYLEVAYFLGITGLIFLLLSLKDKISGNRVVGTSIFILLICGLSQSFMDFPRVAGTAIVLSGLTTVNLREEKL